MGPGSSQNTKALEGARKYHLPCSNPRCAGLALATRGPSRKPKQSEPSLWVGSLPAGVRIEDVGDHSSQV